jgi:hypothetical protein
VAQERLVKTNTNEARNGRSLGKLRFVAPQFESAAVKPLPVLRYDALMSEDSIVTTAFSQGQILLAPSVLGIAWLAIGLTGFPPLRKSGQGIYPFACSASGGEQMFI